MYERTHGNKYHSALGGRYVTASEIAKLMRADIKEQIAKGALPGTARNYRVQVQNSSTSRSINITAIDLDGMWTRCDGFPVDSADVKHVCRNPWCKALDDRPGSEEHDVLTLAGRRVQDMIKAIHDAYNYDGSEIQVDYFDVNYYGSAKVEDNWMRQSRQREAARKEARKARKVMA